MEIEKSLQVLEKSNPIETNKIRDYLGSLNKEIVELGTDRAFALRDKSGEIRCFKQFIELSIQNERLVKIQDKITISAQGYEIWAEAAGASVIFPPVLNAEGKETSNPFVIRDKNNNRILSVYARAIAFRYSSKGIPQVSDWITIYDNPSYRMIDLVGKAKKFKQAFQLLPSELIPKEAGSWAKYTFDEATNLWINTQHEEALSWYSNILNREKKAIDFAQTFAKRNALKHLSGLQTAPAALWKIPVLSWRPIGNNIIKWDYTQYKNLQGNVQKLIEGEKIEFQAGSEFIEPETLKTEAEADIEEQPPDESPPEEAPPETPAEKPDFIDPDPEADSDKQKILKNYQAIVKMFPEETKKAINDLNLAKDEILTIEQMEQIYIKVNEIVDSK